MSEQIIQLIDKEIARLQQARALLSRATEATTESPQTGVTPRRTLSPKARRAIADAQHRRWQKVNAQKKAAGPAPGAAKKEAAAG